MSPNPRLEALQALANGSPSPPCPARPHSSITDLFGSKVFNDACQRQRLTSKAYRALRRAIDHGEELTNDQANLIAGAMKDWAVEHGATHYTHWFQPMTGLTAEKHDSFLSPVVDGGAIHRFSGKELIRGEPDASSFPSGGIRATFEARGYTAWDPTSPAFLRASEYGVTLTIPTAFCSWTGEALDTKTPLLRACESLDRSAKRLLAHLDEHPKKIIATVGPEQEYFLVDQRLFNLRPDLLLCGRTLFGARPPKGQELEDHYFSTTPKRVLNFMMDLEHDLWALGVPAKTRHGEVAPHQYELAPLFEAVSVATDHNMLTMETIQEVAQRHGMRALLHEKPFSYVNGSGKHNNWSMADDEGSNLLEPGSTPSENTRFILCLTAIIRAVDLHQDLIRTSIASAGNDHRLGANEAPPGIISIFLGSELEEIVEALIAGSDARARKPEHLNLGVTTLPPLPQDTTDRNRTSPFAFTGNKFELRALGSQQSIAFPNIILNTIVAESLDYLSSELDKGKGDKTKAIQEVVQKTLAKHQRILFNGDNYTGEWSQEAKKRGLLNITDTPSAIENFANEANIKLFEKYKVLSRREMESRETILFDTYAHRLNVEALAALSIASTQILPAAIKYQGVLASSINATRIAAPKAKLAQQETFLVEVSETICAFKDAIDGLLSHVHEVEDLGSSRDAAFAQLKTLVPGMAELRKHGDHLEKMVDDDLWPLPKYRELLFLH
ncbi:MAG: glutamine synthetase [Planctomycetota bacterium]|jgi:glutamine synthetase